MVHFSPSLNPAQRPFALRPALLLAALLLLVFTGCTSNRRTVTLDRTATVPAQIVSNFFLVQAQQADGRAYRFLIDTGSSATLVTPALAKALRFKEKTPGPATVRVRSAQGSEVELETATLRSLTLGAATFDRVPVLIYDFAELSNHLGLQIDGVIGFPVFRNTLLTLDYPGAQLRIAPQPPFPPPIPRSTGRNSTLAFDNGQGTPLIPVQVGTESFIVLIDSGSDGGLSLNPTGLHPQFASGPRDGTLVASLSGDRRQMVGRLAQNLLLGSHTIAQPVIDLTDQLSSVGGEFLRHFVVTFDQRRNIVTLVRDTDGIVEMAPRRTTGLSFSRSYVYWRVLLVVPDSPAAHLPVQPGDLCVRINGEPVAQWDFERYSTLLKTAAKVTYTLLDGNTERDVEVPVFDLVP